MNEKNLLQARGIVKRYPGAERPAVDHLDLDIGAGEFLSIAGPSGSGKTTLLHILSSLIQADAGQILFQGQDICAAPEAVRNRLRGLVFAVVFQQHHLLPYLSALENVLLPFLGGIKPARAADIATAQAMLSRVGLAGKENSRPGQMSGGEQQRVAIARALVRGAQVLFADEPTGSLDSVNGAAIIQLLRELNSEGLTVVMVTHNDEFAAQSDRIVRMADGAIQTLS
ncbi:MAG: ABC transporter ATP-binding protein [Desulfovibrio sp.]|jgi:putative ABC transport system ATP-binding protein|nr:ABC transporter ATP-binding protein [Desulfovibrio sp.]